MTTLPASPQHHVLRDPLFRVRPTRYNGERANEERVGLPEVVARLMIGEDIDLLGITLEQRGLWWRFLVRMAAKAFRVGGIECRDLDGVSIGELGEALRNHWESLLPQEYWYLFQPDIEIPGFLQAAGEGEHLIGAGYKKQGLAYLSLATGSKNHEFKPGAIHRLAPDEAAVGLVTLQAGSIYTGPGQYSTQLKGSKSGQGSGCPFMGARIGSSNNETFRHDLNVFLEQWDTIESEHGLQGPHWALWGLPWNGSKPFGSTITLDPAFIPLARIVRLPEFEEGYIKCVWDKGASSDIFQDHTGGGNLGDVWAPLIPLDAAKSKGTHKIRGTMSKGYDYKETAMLIFGIGGTVPSPSVAAALLRAEGDVRVRLEGVAFSQGKTEGFYSREVLLPAKAKYYFQNPEPMRRAHGAMLSTAKQAKGILAGALRIYMTGESKSHPNDGGKVERYIDELDRLIDGSYFEHLLRIAGALDGWKAPVPAPAETEKGRRGAKKSKKTKKVKLNDGEKKEETENSEVEAALLPEEYKLWLQWLTGRAREVFERSMAALPVVQGKRLERQSGADGYLNGSLWSMTQSWEPLVEADIDVDIEINANENIDEGGV